MQPPHAPSIQSYALSTQDDARWRQVMPAHVSVTASVEYMRACEKHGGAAARLFVVESPQATVAYPLFLRSIGELPFAENPGEEFDSFTPPYTGPIVVRATDKASLEELGFSLRFHEYCRSNGIIAEFAHLNPFAESNGLLDEESIDINREVVYVDLTWTEDEIWSKSLTSACRRQIRRSRETNVQIRRAASTRDIHEFHRLHTLTMDRRQALDRYYYESEYFDDLLGAMPANAFVVLAEHEDKVIAGGLFLHDDTTIQFDLSAADLAFAALRPVSAYIFDTITWAAGAGKKRMLLGGSYSDGDGVFRFKTNFSPLRAQFSTFRRIHDARAYQTLTQAWSTYHGGEKSKGNYFPAYRAAPPVTTEESSQS